MKEKENKVVKKKKKCKQRNQKQNRKNNSFCTNTYYYKQVARGAKKKNGNCAKLLSRTRKTDWKSYLTAACSHRHNMALETAAKQNQKRSPLDTAGKPKVNTDNWFNI